MTAYQRGARDALLDAAASMERMATMYRDDADKVRAGRGYRADNPHHVATARASDDKASAYTNAATMLRRASEAMPEDPEAPDAG